MKHLIVLFSSMLWINSFGQIDSLKLDQNLDEVVITINSGPREFYSKSDHFILDMLEDSSGIIVLFKKQNNYSIEKLNWNGIPVVSAHLPFKTTRLTSDCLGNIYMYCKNDFYQRFHFSNDSVVLDETYSAYSYAMEIEPCVANSNSLLLFKSLSDKNQTVVLWKFDFSNDSSQTVYSYSDSLVLLSNQDEQQIIEVENHNNHERMGDIWVHELEALKDKQERAMFFTSIVTQAPYTPIFSHRRMHYFFNFPTDSVLLFDIDFTLITQLISPISRGTKTKGSILMDKTNGQFYYVNSKKMRLERFSIGNNQQMRTYVSKGIQSSRKFIHDNKLFFLGKSARNDSFNKIFREKL